MATKKDLLQAFSKMEAERKTVIETLSKNEVVLLDKKPDPNSWSVTEVIMHLVAAETGALKYMQKKLEFGGHQKAGIGAAFKQRLLNFAISIPGLKFKAPKVAQIQEGSTISFNEAAAQWENVRSELQKQYEAFDDSLVDSELFKHPAAGKLSALQSVRFMRLHMNRHIKQMNQTIERVA